MIARLKQLVIEAHRRSLWQVLGVYVLSSWVVLQVVDTLTGVFGLPHWVPQFALVLLIIGLPIVMATAVVQEGGPAPARAPAPAPAVTGPGFLRRHLTWKRSLLGGVGAFAFLGLLTGGYLAAWATGIGPMGSLVARGEITEGEAIVLADFAFPPGDPGIGRTVTESLRIDLIESPVLRVLEPADVREVLRRMEVPPDAPLTAELAREVAVREGLQAYLEGEVSRLGAGYVLTANLRDAETERSLAPFRETARSDDELITSLEALSRRIRERAGESLRSIHAGPGLERVTTSSLPALRLYTEALEPFNRGDYAGAVRLLEEAVELDPDFAMAWRGLSVALGNPELDRVREREAAEEAYRLRHRLSERERFLTEARYHRSVTGDVEARMEAYGRVLRVDPYDRAALNNLGLDYARAGDWDAAGELHRRAVDRPGTPPAVAFRNLIRSRIARGHLDEALEVLERFAEVHPESILSLADGFWVHFIRGDEASARAHNDLLLAEGAHNPQARIQGHDHAGRLALWRGRLGEAREQLAEAEAAAREIGPSAHLVWRLFRTHGEVVVGQNERALALLSEAERDGMFAALPPSDQWHFFHANLLGMAGRPDDAEAVLRRFEEEVPEGFHDTFHYRNESARFFVVLHRGDPEEAIRILEYIRTTEPCGLCFAERMGWALREAGRLEEAAEEWEAALAWRDLRHAMNWQLGQNLWIMQRIGSLYEELGDTERALHHYRRFAELWAEADPELQPVVERARERIRALEAAGNRYPTRGADPLGPAPASRE